MFGIFPFSFVAKFCQNDVFFVIFFWVSLHTIFAAPFHQMGPNYEQKQWEDEQIMKAKIKSGAADSKSRNKVRCPCSLFAFLFWQVSLV